MEQDHELFVEWGGGPVHLTWEPNKRGINLSQVTSVHGFCFYKDLILLTKIEGRGFNVPGGHVEEAETPEEAFKREAMEEGYVNGDMAYLGAIRVSHQHNPLFNPNGKYPMIGYQLFYRMDVNACFPFQREFEAKARIWVEPAEVPFIVDDHRLTNLILDEALKTEKK
jgi:8-oxo-dGTP diphosphatase